MITRKICKTLLMLALLLPAVSQAEEAAPVDIIQSETATVQIAQAELSDVVPEQVGDTLQDTQGDLAQEGMPLSSPTGGATSEDKPAVTGAPAEEPVAEELIADPLEPFNRVMFEINDKLYFYLFKPFAQIYSFVTPEPVRLSVRNFFTNVTMPVRLVSSLVQGKGMVAGRELVRFGINTTVGIGGLFDVAKAEFDISGQDEDLGQALGHYGMGGMIYIVWPLFGPSTVRDTIGSVGDAFLNPVNYINGWGAPLHNPFNDVGPWELEAGINGLSQVNRTSLEIGEYEDLIEAALEPYTAVRDAYIQYRNKLIKE